MNLFDDWFAISNQISSCINSNNCRRQIINLCLVYVLPYLTLCKATCPCPVVFYGYVFSAYIHVDYKLCLGLCNVDAFYYILDESRIK